MQDNSKFDELLISFLANELNEEDEALVLEWISFSDEHRQYFEKLSAAWKLLNAKLDSDTINVNDEWKRFEGSINNHQPKPSVLKEVQEFAGIISEEEKPKSTSLFYKIAVSTAVAASLIFLLVFASGLFSTNKTVPKQISKLATEKPDSQVTATLHVTNTTGKSKRVMLNDGTEIILADKSELSYADLLIHNKREVVLKGKAYFKVAKDKLRPFTVFTNDISTTVLGTKFTVTAFENEKHISVRLYEGRVVVKGVLILKKKRINNYYLQPGQELIFNHLTSVVTLKKFAFDHPAIGKKENADKVAENLDLPVIPYTDKGAWYMFNNQSLGQVFEELEKMYDVKIVYSKKEIADKYFIGKFEKSDPIETVLKQIAGVNNLKVTKKADQFIISKY
jgi:transmembrane sensor